MREYWAKKNPLQAEWCGVGRWSDFDISICVPPSSATEGRTDKTKLQCEQWGESGSIAVPPFPLMPPAPSAWLAYFPLGHKVGWCRGAP